MLENSNINLNDAISGEISKINARQQGVLAASKIAATLANGTTFKTLNDISQRLKDSITIPPLNIEPHFIRELNLPIPKSPLPDILNNAEIQTEALKTMVEILKEQNKTINEQNANIKQQEKDNKTMRTLTIISVIIMFVTLVVCTIQLLK